MLLRFFRRSYELLLINVFNLIGIRLCNQGAEDYMKELQFFFLGGGVVCFVLRVFCVFCLFVFASQTSVASAAEKDT